MANMLVRERGLYIYTSALRYVKSGALLYGACAENYPVCTWQWSARKKVNLTSKSPSL